MFVRCTRSGVRKVPLPPGSAVGGVDCAGFCKGDSDWMEGTALARVGCRPVGCSSRFRPPLMDVVSLGCGGRTGGDLGAVDWRRMQRTGTACCPLQCSKKAFAGDKTRLRTVCVRILGQLDEKTLIVFVTTMIRSPASCRRCKCNQRHRRIAR